MLARPGKKCAKMRKKNAQNALKMRKKCAKWKKSAKNPENLRNCWWTQKNQKNYDFLFLSLLKKHGLKKIGEKNDFLFQICHILIILKLGSKNCKQFKNKKMRNFFSKQMRKNAQKCGKMLKFPKKKENAQKCTKMR